MERHSFRILGESVSVSKALFCVLVGLELAGAGCGGGAKAQGGAPPGVPVQIQVAQEVPVENTTEYVATLKSRDAAIIEPQVQGWVTAIYVHSGDRVKAGEPLMQIDPSKQEATVNSQESSRRAQEANLVYAQQQYKRTNGLYAAGVVSRQDLDQAKSALDAAKAQLNSLSAQLQEQQVELHYYKVISPRGGIVGDIPVRIGDQVTTTTWLTTVDTAGGLEAYIYVPVERAAELKMGLPVEIVDANGKEITGSRISFISPEVDNTTQSVLVKAPIADSNREALRNAQFIRARIVWGSEKHTLVPVLAVSRIGGQYFAFLAEEQNGKLIAHQKPLSVGPMVGNDYVVLQGVEPGDKVIVSGTQFLVDGVPVFPQGKG
jgi:RND family efflux transporter MFP subunit